MQEFQVLLIGRNGKVSALRVMAESRFEAEQMFVNHPSVEGAYASEVE